MVARQPQQSGGSDNSSAPIWITVFICALIFLFWDLAHQYIVAFVFYINILQAKLINLFVNDTQLEGSIYLMQTISPDTVSWQQFLDITKSVGDYVRYPIIALLIILALVLYRSDISLRFRRAHDMKTLRAQEQRNWLAIMPIIKEDLANVDISTGPWAMALTPIEFARKYKLLRLEDALLDAPAAGQEMMTAGLRKGDAKRVFTLQLGPYWDGFERCPLQAAALAAVFMARINRDREAASSILEALNKSYATSKIDFSVAKSVLYKYKDKENIQEIVSKHAYLLTVMAALLQAARADGVVPSSEFIWLKPTDRRLWYMLNSIGRQTPFAEVAGPYAHWCAENTMGRRSLVPMIDTAIKALELAIKEVKLPQKELQALEP